MKVLFVKNGMAYGLGYHAGETAELPQELVNDLMEKGVVRITGNSGTNPADSREKAVSKAAANKETR